MWPNTQEPADLVTFTHKNPDGKTSNIWNDKK